MNTFSQDHGLEEPPGQPALGELPREARILLWEVFYATTTRAAIGNAATGFLRVLLVDDWEHVVLSLARKYLHLSSDDLSYEDSPWVRGTNAHAVRRAFRPFFCQDTPYNRVFDLVQDAMRHEQCPPVFVERIKKAFEECDVAYFVDTSGPPTILPAVTTEEREAIRLAQQGLADAGHSAAHTHLRRAGELFRGGEWRESLHQSISAVETVAKRFDLGEKKLSKILTKLQNDASLDIHPALGVAFETLYGWTSDQPGVRHGDPQKRGRVGRAEAAFMVSACAAFCTYLLDKRRAAGQSDDSGGEPGP